MSKVMVFRSRNKKNNTVYTRLSAVAFISFNRLKGGGVYLRAALIRGRRLNIGQNKQYTYKVTKYYAKFQVSTPWGLGRSWQAASNLSTVCGTYFSSSSRQKLIVRPYVGRDAVSF